MASIQSEVDEIRITYKDGSGVTITKYEIDRMLKATDALELMEHAKQTARRLVDVSSK